MALRLRATFAHTLFGVDVSGALSLSHSGEIPAELLDRVPADDLTRRILSGDYIAIPTEDEPEKVWEPSDLLRAVLAERGVVVGDPVPVPEEGVIGRFTPEPSHNDDDADLDDAELAAAAKIAEDELKAALAEATLDEARIAAETAKLAAVQAKQTAAAARKSAKAAAKP